MNKLNLNKFFHASVRCIVVAASLAFCFSSASGCGSEEEDTSTPQMTQGKGEGESNFETFLEQCQNGTLCSNSSTDDYVAFSNSELESAFKSESDSEGGTLACICKNNNSAKPLIVIHKPKR